MSRRLALIAATVTALAATGCGGGGKSSATKTSARTTPSVSAATGCRTASRPAPKGAQHLARPALKLDRKRKYTAVVETNCGTFRIALDVKRAPKTSASFVYLARKRFFDGLTFHRVVSGFVIQGGDPLGTGQGGPGYSVVEAPPSDLSYTRGVVAMAKTQTEDAGTSGSQFFVVTGEDAQLPPQYALLGKVSGGEATVARIGVVPTNPQDDQPLEPVVIESLRIEESG